MSTASTIILIVTLVALLAVSATVSYGINKQRKNPTTASPRLTNPLAFAQKIQQQISQIPKTPNKPLLDIPTLQLPAPQQLQRQFDKQIADLQKPDKKKKTTINNIDKEVYTDMAKNNGFSQKPVSKDYQTVSHILSSQTSSVAHDDPKKYQYYDYTTGKLTTDKTHQPNEQNVPLDFELDIQDGLIGDAFNYKIDGINYYNKCIEPPQEKYRTIKDLLDQGDAALLRATFSKIVQNPQFQNKVLAVEIDGHEHLFKIPDNEQWKQDFITAMKYKTGRSFDFPTNEDNKTFKFTPDIDVTKHNQRIVKIEGLAITDAVGGPLQPDQIDLNHDAKLMLVSKKFYSDNGHDFYDGYQLYQNNNYLLADNPNSGIVGNYTNLYEDIKTLLENKNNANCKDALAIIHRQLCKNITTSADEKNTINLIESGVAPTQTKMIVCIQEDKEGHRTIKRIYDFRDNRMFDFVGANKNKHIFSKCEHRINSEATTNLAPQNVGIPPLDRLSFSEAKLIVDALGYKYKNAVRDGFKEHQKKKLRVGDNGKGKALRNFYKADGTSIFTFVSEVHHKLPNRTHMLTPLPTKTVQDVGNQGDQIDKIVEYDNFNTSLIDIPSGYSSFGKTKKIINDMQPGNSLASANIQKVPDYTLLSF